jgi:transcription initiation factor TFIID subunit TAF12
MPEIVDTDAKMQESVPEFLVAVFQASKERQAKRKLAVQQQAQAKEAQIAQAEQKPREVAGAGGGGQDLHVEDI